MHALSAAIVVATLATGLNASTIVARDSLGTFDTFTDSECSQGAEGVTVSDKDSKGMLRRGAMSVKSYLSTCDLYVRGFETGLIISNGDSECYDVTKDERFWEVHCNN